MDFSQLYEQLKLLGAKVLKDTLEGLKTGKLTRTQQNQEQSSSVSYDEKRNGTD